MLSNVFVFQVRGRSSNQNFTWSEPVLIDTLSMSAMYIQLMPFTVCIMLAANERQEPQFLIRTTSPFQLYFVHSNPFKTTSLPIMGAAIAIDKFNRTFFYSTANSIMRANIDAPNMSQVH